jgi:hypothetical protein
LNAIQALSQLSYGPTSEGGPLERFPIKLNRKLL